MNVTREVKHAMCWEGVKMGASRFLTPSPFFKQNDFLFITMLILVNLYDEIT